MSSGRCGNGVSSLPTRPDAEEIELDDSFWAHAKWIPPLFPRKTSVHLRLDQDVLDWFKGQGKGHLTRMNAVLRTFVFSREDRALREDVAAGPARRIQGQEYHGTKSAQARRGCCPPA